MRQHVTSALFLPTASPLVALVLASSVGGCAIWRAPDAPHYSIKDTPPAKTAEPSTGHIKPSRASYNAPASVDAYRSAARRRPPNETADKKSHEKKPQTASDAKTAVAPLSLAGTAPAAQSGTTRKIVLRTPVLDAAGPDAQVCLAAKSCVSAVTGLVQDPTLSWLRDTPRLEDDLTGARLHALSTVKVQMSCADLELAEQEVEGSETRLKAILVDEAQPPKIAMRASSHVAVARAVRNELLNETESRCR